MSPFDIAQRWNRQGCLDVLKVCAFLFVSLPWPFFMFIFFLSFFLLLKQGHLVSIFVFMTSFFVHLFHNQFDFFL